MERGTLDTLMILKHKLRSGLSSEVTLETLIDVLIENWHLKEERVKKETDMWLASRGLEDITKGEY